MAYINCTISGVASSAYANRGNYVGTIPTIAYRSGDTYRISVTTDIKNQWLNFNISAYNATNSDGIGSYIESINGNPSIWDENSGTFELYNTSSCVIDITFSEHPTHIYISPPSNTYKVGHYLFNGVGGPGNDGSGNYRWNVNKYFPIVNKPHNVRVKQEGTDFVVNWDRSTYENGDPGAVPTYRVSFFGDKYKHDVGTNNSLTTAIPEECYGFECNFYVQARYSGRTATSGPYLITPQRPNPVITKQPVITNMEPREGTFTKITCSEAEGQYMDGATIYYQYFVGPTPEYSDSYCVAEKETTTTFTITEAHIRNKCGNNFSGTCYVYVRAYWRKGDLEGGWYSPTGMPFTYTPYTTVKYCIDNNNWQECIPYYFDGNNWQLCEIWYHDGSGWKPCSHT